MGLKLYSILQQQNHSIKSKTNLLRMSMMTLIEKCTTSGNQIANKIKQIFKNSKWHFKKYVNFQNFWLKINQGWKH